MTTTATFNLEADIREHPLWHRPDPKTVQTLGVDGGGMLVLAMCICGHEDCCYSEMVTHMTSSSSGAFAHRPRLTT